jgi:hypothetical protein
MTESPRPSSGSKQEREAAEHVAEAHRLLSGLKHQLDKHPDLEQAISNLELALSILTTKTGGML